MRKRFVTMPLNYSDPIKTMRIVDYLYDTQCSLQSFSVEPSPQNAISLIFTRSGAPVSFNFNLRGNRLHWQAPNGWTGSAQAGRFFRLNPFSRVEQVGGIESAPRQFSERMISAITGVGNQAARILRHFFLGGLDVDTRGLSRDLLEGMLSPGRSRGGGFVCRWSLEAGGEVRVVVVDHGDAARLVQGEQGQHPVPDVDVQAPRAHPTGRALDHGPR